MNSLLTKIKTTCEPKTGNFVDIKGNKIVCPSTCSSPCSVSIDQVANEPYYDSTCVANVFNEYLSTLDANTKVNIENECLASSNNSTNFKNNIISLCDIGVTQIADATTSCKMNKVINSDLSASQTLDSQDISIQDIIVFSTISVTCLIICAGYLDILLKFLFVLIFTMCGYVYYLYRFENSKFKKLVSTLQTQNLQN